MLVKLSTFKKIIREFKQVVEDSSNFFMRGTPKISNQFNRNFPLPRREQVIDLVDRNRVNIMEHAYKRMNQRNVTTEDLYKALKNGKIERSTSARFGEGKVCFIYGPHRIIASVKKDLIDVVTVLDKNVPY